MHLSFDSPEYRCSNVSIGVGSCLGLRRPDIVSLSYLENVSSNHGASGSCPSFPSLPTLICQPQLPLPKLQYLHLSHHPTFACSHLYVFAISQQLHDKRVTIPTSRTPFSPFSQHPSLSRSFPPLPTPHSKPHQHHSPKH